MRTHSLRGALRQEIRRAFSRQGAIIGKRLHRARVFLRALRATVRRQTVDLARAERRLTKLRVSRSAARRAAGATVSGPRMSPRQIRAARGARSRRAFAEILGVSANSIFLWETARARPRGVNLARLDRAKAGSAKRGPGRPRSRRPTARRTSRARTGRRQT